MSLNNFENVGYFIKDCNGTNLRYDEACLQVLTTEKVGFWSQYLECEGCMLLETAKFASPRSLVVRTTSPLLYSIHNTNGQICNGSYQFYEYGQYQINLTAVTSDHCAPTMTAEPDAANLPILTAVVVLLSMATLWYIVKGIGKRILAGRYFAREDNELGSDTRVLTAESSAPRSPARSRLRSLDIFRGISLALMIFVNAGGGGYAIFNHSVWNGLTVADVLFPWFAFAMGEALVLSVNGKLRMAAMSRTSAMKQVAIRSLLLSLLGITLGSVRAGWATVRLPGVLQRLAAMYLIAGLTECLFARTSQNITPGHSLFRDITAGWMQWLATILIVSIQVCVTLLVPAPGCPRGYAGPGGLHLSAALGDQLQNCTGGIAGYIDRTILGPSHLYHYGKFVSVYRTTLPHDPEGILGVLSGLLVVQAGAHATRIILAYNHARARIIRWVLWSVIFGVTGGALCVFSNNGGPIPINKSLWSLSYCLVTASMAFFIQAVLYYVVDLKNKWGGRPFYYAGQNSIVLYMGSELMKNHFPFHIATSAATHSLLLATHSLTTLIWLALAVVLHRKRIFISL